MTLIAGLWMVAVVALAADGDIYQRHAPIIERRANAVGTQSDIPLFLYVEQLKDDAGAEYLQYSVIFSNEDGGTETRALMARWGRTTDIEWVYRVWVDAAGRRVRAMVQGKDHKDTEFTEPFEADHPVLAVITDNNMVGVGGTGRERANLKPVLVDLTGASREKIMDEHPEFYRISAEELEREGRTGEIGDSRDYLYVEAEIASQDARVAVWCRLKAGAQWYSSHRGREAWAIERSGFVRTTIKLPNKSTLDDIAEIGFECLGAGTCEVKQVTKVFLLDSGYRPGPSIWGKRLDRQWSAGEMVTWSLQSK
ncbi:MAG: hypothetical protein IT168_20685 [Bryobacterales bacterium]|nr:hypothetical protein [Bryobacterales bacterium]